MKNIFELAQEQKAKALQDEVALIFTFNRDRTRSFIAANLYEAAYGDKRALSEFTNGETIDPATILDKFCEITFGVSCEAVLKAYGKFLG